MMAANAAAAEAGGGNQSQDQDNWWLTRYSHWFSTMGALLLAFVSGLGILFNIISLNPVTAFSCGLQVAAAVIILAIEAPTVVSFLTFAKPIGAFFDGRPLYVKTTVFGGLTIFPMLLGPSGLSVMLGFIISGCITGLYGMILIGRRGADANMMGGGIEQPRI